MSGADEMLNCESSNISLAWPPSTIELPDFSALSAVLRALCVAYFF